MFMELDEQSTELLEMSNVQMLAELSGGIAHEINNPLTVISALSMKLKRNIKSENGTREENLEYLEKINTTVFRISKN